ncbi:hypothetical protein WDU94_002622 [Cyamophila willieti]
MYNGTRYSNTCEVQSSNLMKCKTPTIKATIGNTTIPQHVEYGFDMNPFPGFQNMSKQLNNSFLLYNDPIYYHFVDEIKIYSGHDDYLTINGKYLNLVFDERDVQVRIGIGVCNVSSISNTQLTCKPPVKQPPNRLNDNQKGTTELPNVTVIVANTLMFYVGKLNYSQPEPEGIGDSFFKTTLCGIIFICISVAILVNYVCCKSTKKAKKVQKNLQRQMDILEVRVAAEYKKAFAELQTEMTDLTRDLTMDGIPFRDYSSYVMKVLFPNSDQLGVLRFERSEVNQKDALLSNFNDLIMNRTFLLTFLQTLESNPNFTMSDRVKVASLIMVALQSKMQYCTNILKTLLAELIEKCIHTKLNPTLLLRRTDSVAAKMLSNWFSFLLYKFLRDSAGEPLYMLFRAIKQQLEKGPVDAITGQGRYSLSEDKLIGNVIEFKPMTVSVSIGRYKDIPVHVQDCDTISQVKEKSLDTIYRASPYSTRLKKEDLDIEWQTGNTKNLILLDFDDTNDKEGEWKRLNTLNHYNVPDCAHLTLKESNTSNLDGKTSNPSKMKQKSYNHKNKDIVEKKWHLIKEHDNDNLKKGVRNNETVSTVYLTRLLTTKEALQKFVDDLFKTIFSTGDRGSPVPLAIKNMFDFFDDQALKHDIRDPKVLHTWKSNALPLRFWVNLIKNPDFLFDIHKSNTVDSCLSVVAQSFMDSCGTSDHRLGTDSPCSRLLYAKNIPVYKEMAEHYYSEIKTIQITDQEMDSMLEEESTLHASDLKTNWALYELYTYASKYKEQLSVALKEDPISQDKRLAQLLEQLFKQDVGHHK